MMNDIHNTGLELSPEEVENLIKYIEKHRGQGIEFHFDSNNLGTTKIKVSSYYEDITDITSNV